MMGTGHNLGGHAFVNGAMVLDMRQFNRVLSLDRERKRITVESGITWDKIQEAVSPAGLALKAMQSDNIFTVGGSLAANAHGRDTRFPTLVDSVLGFRILLADGSVKSVSRSENSDLFRNAIGGYGLFGVMLEMDLELVDRIVFAKDCSGSIANATWHATSSCLGCRGATIGGKSSVGRRRNSLRAIRRGKHWCRETMLCGLRFPP